MSRDTIVKDDQGKQYSLDNLSTQRWLEGQEHGVEIAAKFIKDKSLEAFGRSQDKEALMLRGLADEIVKKLIPELKSKSKQHKERFPIEVKDDDS